MYCFCYKYLFYSVNLKMCLYIMVRLTVYSCFAGCMQTYFIYLRTAIFDDVIELRYNLQVRRLTIEYLM